LAEGFAAAKRLKNTVRNASITNTYKRSINFVKSEQSEISSTNGEASLAYGKHHKAAKGASSVWNDNQTRMRYIDKRNLKIRSLPLFHLKGEKT